MSLGSLNVIATWGATHATTANANGTSDPIDLHLYKVVGLQVVTTGTGTATLTAEVCDNPHTETVGDPAKVQPQAAGATWTPYTGFTFTKPADGTAGNEVTSTEKFPHRWLRFRLASTSGTYTVKIFVAAKN